MSKFDKAAILVWAFTPWMLYAALLGLMFGSHVAAILYTSTSILILSPLFAIFAAFLAWTAATEVYERKLETLRKDLLNEISGLEGVIEQSGFGDLDGPNK